MNNDNNKTTTANILLIDDHPAVRQGLRLILETRNHKIVAESEGIEDTVALLKSVQIDVAILDLTLRKESGLNLLPELNAHKIATVIYSMHEDSELIKRAFRFGALGYVNKQEDPEILFEAINAVAQGEKYLSSNYDQISVTDENENKTTEFVLSEKERQIFLMISRGYGNKQIAEEFDISSRTVDTYLARMVTKLELGSIRSLRKYIMSTRIDV